MSENGKDREQNAVDCVELKRKGVRHIYELTKNMSPEEELRFWQHETAKVQRNAAERRAS